MKAILKNRSDIDIMASILKNALPGWQYQTTIMNEADVSHSQITRYLSAAVEKGLMNYSDITRMYRTGSYLHRQV